MRALFNQLGSDLALRTSGDVLIFGPTSLNLFRDVILVYYFFGGGSPIKRPSMRDYILFNLFFLASPEYTS